MHTSSDSEQDLIYTQVERVGVSCHEGLIKVKVYKYLSNNYSKSGLKQLVDSVNSNKLTYR